MTAILALDLSLTGTGWATTPNIYGVLDPKTRRGPHRLSWIRDEILHLEHIHGPVELVAIEGYSYGSQTSQAHSLGELGGVVRCSLYDADIPHIDVPPSTVKTYATGKGNASKDLVRDAARDRFSLPPGVTSDECDALWILATVADAAGHPIVTVPATHRRAITKPTKKLPPLVDRVAALLEGAVDAA